MEPRNTLLVLGRSPRIVGWAGLGLLVLSSALLFVLRALPYSSCRLTSVSAAEAKRRPTPDSRLGPLSWPVTQLKKEPALGPFREAFRSDCGSARGLQAAACAAIALARRSPFGRPDTEFVDRDFDPVKHLKRHMAGAPGHCLTRSAIIATQLLSVGIPARVVQLVPAQGKGHTVVVVWDETAGWTVIDPTFGGIVTGPEGNSPTDLLAAPASARWTPLRSVSFPPSTSLDQQRYLQSVLQGDLFYPEPWLYLRIGERAAPWPFRGHYVRIGPTFLTLGPAQRVLGGAIPVLGFIGVALVVTGWCRRDIKGVVARRRGVLPDLQALGDPDAAPPG